MDAVRAAWSRAGGPTPRTATTDPMPPGRWSGPRTTRVATSRPVRRRRDLVHRAGVVDQQCAYGSAGERLAGTIEAREEGGLGQDLGRGSVATPHGDGGQSRLSRPAGT